MPAIPVLLFFSLLLAATFVVLFARDHRRRRFANAERDSLLPLADETPHVTPEASTGQAHAELAHEHDHDHEHDHAHGAACGCRDGSRPPCPGCLRRRDDTLRATA
jgi:hypothetical protein